MIVSYHAANWTCVVFCLIGMPVFTSKLTFHDLFSYENYDLFLACILSILFFRGIGVVGHRGIPKVTSAEEQEQDILTPSKDVSPK